MPNTTPHALDESNATRRTVADVAWDAYVAGYVAAIAGVLQPLRDYEYVRAHAESAASAYTDARPQLRAALASARPRYSTPACPEHGDTCVGADCCCADRHPDAASARPQGAEARSCGRASMASPRAGGRTMPAVPTRRRRGPTSRCLGMSGASGKPQPIATPHAPAPPRRRTGRMREPVHCTRWAVIDANGALQYVSCFDDNATAKLDAEQVAESATHHERMDHRVACVEIREVVQVERPAWRYPVLSAEEAERQARGRHG